MENSTIQRPVLATLLTTVFLDFLGFSIILPYLFFFAQSLGASTFAYGIIVSSYAAEQLIFAPLLGRLSDRHGRRKVLVITLLGSSFSYVIFGMSNVLWLLLLSRMLAGAFSGTYPVVQAYVADVTSKRSRLKYMGYLGAAYGLGYVLGPVLGGTISEFYGYATPSFIAAVIALSNCALMYLTLPESKKLQVIGINGASLLTSLRRAFDRKQLNILLVLNFVSTLAFVFLLVILPPWLQSMFGFGAFETGLILFYSGIVSIMTVAIVVPRLSRRFSPATLVLAGLTIVSLDYFGLGLIREATLATLLSGFVMAGLLAFGFSLLGPATNTLISFNASNDEQGRALGFAQSAASLARVLAPSIAALIFSMGSSLGDIGLVFFVAALVNSATLPLIFFFRRGNYGDAPPIKLDINIDSNLTAANQSRSPTSRREVSVRQA